MKASPNLTAVMRMVRTLDASIQRLLGGRVVGTYLHGSIALGGFNPKRSDVDLLSIAHDSPRIEVEDLRDVAAQATATNGPGVGLELSVVDAAQSAHPTAPWPFLLHVTTNPNDSKVVIGREHPGDADLLIHYAVTRAAGITVRGPTPTALIGEVSRVDLLRYLTDELAWALRHADETYAVLNAGRALNYLHEGQLVSKVDVGPIALAAGAPPHIVEHALKVQTGNAADRSLTPDAIAFVRKVHLAMQAAADAE